MILWYDTMGTVTRGRIWHQDNGRVESCRLSAASHWGQMLNLISIQLPRKWNILLNGRVELNSQDSPLAEGLGYWSCRNRDPAGWWAACSGSTHSVSRAWQNPPGKWPGKAVRVGQHQSVTPQLLSSLRTLGLFLHSDIKGAGLLGQCRKIKAPLLSI